jgi:hypothetical protein
MEQPPYSLLAEIAAVMKMDGNALRARYGAILPSNATRCTTSLRSEIIYLLQERHYKKSLGEKTVDALNCALALRRERSNEREVHAPGTQYVRIWKGERHTIVYRGHRAYEYKGATYRSPSEIAKLITGCNWNGRQFFHMPPLKGKE